MASDIKTLTLRIHGRVQGVWYRGWTVDTAKALGLSGWVRNRSDGTVEALVHGAAAQVDELVRRCHQGPTAAKVSKIDQEPTGEVPESGFHQRSTY